MRPELVEDLRLAAVADVERPLHAVVSEQGLITDADTLQLIVSDVQRELHGLGPLAPYAELPGITDILVNGSREVWIDGPAGLQRSDFRFDTESSVRRLAVRLASMAGRRLDDAAPWVDARLPNGMRLHAVLHPLSRDGTSISLRIPATTPYALTDLRDRGMFSVATATRLQRLVRDGEPLLIAGGTGTGKTTLLAALLAEVPHRERIVVAEDSAELRIEHPHVVYLEGRPPNLEGAGAITLRDLVRQSLRMRPDRLIVGEVRGNEVQDLLNALNTGHAGGAATVHANSAADAITRLELLAMQAGMESMVARRAILSAFSAIVHIGRDRRGVRRVREVLRMDAVESDSGG